MPETTKNTPWTYIQVHIPLRRDKARYIRAAKRARLSLSEYIRQAIESRITTDGLEAIKTARAAKG